MNEMRTILEQSVSRLFAEKLDWDALTRIEQEGWPDTLWKQVCEQGIERVLGSEQGGGMDGAWADAYPVLRACGRYAVPLPVAEAVLAHALARAAATALPDGVPGLIDGNHALDGEHVTLERVSVPWARRADYLVGVSAGELFVASSVGLDIVDEDNIGRDPRGRVSGKARLLGRYPLDLPPDAVHWLGALARSAQIAGGGAAALDLAVRYASEREQFGRPLSRFQAIQHHLADLGGVVASVDAMTMAACAALDRRGLSGAARDARFEIAAAKTRASEAVEKITRLSHQVHGAIGFTYEYGLHFVTRRLWAWRAEFGGATEWGDWLGTQALAAGGDGIWPMMADD